MAKRHPGANATSPWPFVGMGGMAINFFLYASTGLLAPWWAAVLLMLVWVGLMVLATAWWTPRPRWVFYVAVFAVTFWFATINVGAFWWGWTA